MRLFANGILMWKEIYNQWYANTTYLDISSRAHKRQTPVPDGLEATERIRKQVSKDAKTIPIIALTVNVFDEDVQRSTQAGLDAHHCNR